MKKNTTFVEVDAAANTKVDTTSALDNSSASHRLDLVFAKSSFAGNTLLAVQDGSNFRHRTADYPLRNQVKVTAPGLKIYGSALCGRQPPLAVLRVTRISNLRRFEKWVRRLCKPSFHACRNYATPLKEENQAVHQLMPVYNLQPPTLMPREQRS